MRTFKDIDKIIKHVSEIETTCDEATIKQIVCILISRLLNPKGAEETAGLIAGLAEAEQEVLNALKNKKKETLH
tara:strand:- start:7842 stop:8063 length:222 start_codon:yes stop_codon:yes gene_type:complete